MDVFINAISENIVEIVSLVSASAIAIVSAIQSRKSQLETNSLTEKLNQINVDANLKASARIEWIQNVRRTTAQLLSSYFSILRTVKTEELPKLINKCADTTNIMCSSTNQGKNNMIIELLDEIQKKLTRMFIIKRQIRLIN